MKRKLLFGERLMLGDGKTPFNGIIPVKIRGEFSAASLHHALLRLQQKHPWLNAVISYDKNNRPSFTTDTVQPVKIPVQIISRHKDTDWEVESVKQWSIPFETDRDPMMRMVWLKGEGVSELIMVIHHCLIDGGSILTLLTTLYELIDNGDADIGQENPIKGIHDIVPAEILGSRKKRLKASLIGSIAVLGLWLTPLKKKAVARQKDYLIHWTVEEEMTVALTQLCKNSGVTMNTLLCAVLLKTFKEVRKDNAHNKISCPVDLRNLNHRIKKDNIFAFGSMFVVSSYADLDFMSNLKAIQEDIRQKIKKLDPHLMLMVLEKAHPVLHKFGRFLKYSKSNNDCMFSNLGRITIPAHYKTFEIEMICTPTAIGPLGNTTSLITSTYRGKMDFSFVASEGYVPYLEGQAIQTRMMTILKEQLQTQLQPA
ncbi:Condensation domain protein [Pedobacter cryoconitis]|uniref:Condensation domain protein n=1 Tax=Pedobacter cryoconitis TaxID=188932 RepID=A0A127V773_9SPHI|nr:condensation domain-containing protein [Pedobacter cryoconitis]AMP97143.1 Condensation domain protein [Pedobacter cryoconitis]